MKITITTEDQNIGYLMQDDEDNTLNWHEMSLDQKLEAIEMMQSGADFFKRFLGPKELKD